MQKKNLFQNLMAFTISVIVTSVIYFLNASAMSAGFNATKFDWYRTMSKQFFIRCDGYYCESIFIPFIGYVTNFNQSFIAYTKLNFSLLYGAIAIFTFLTLIKFNLKLAAIIISYVLFSLHFYLNFTSPNFPDLLFILTVIGSYQAIILNSRLALWLVVISFMLHPTLAALIYASFFVYLLGSSTTKNDRLGMLKVGIYSVIGFFIIKVYLFLIITDGSESRLSYLVENWGHVIKNSALLSAPISSTLNTAPLMGLICLLSIMKKWGAIIFILVALLLGLILQFIALDEVRIFRCYFVPISTAIFLNATTNIKKY
ncbi:hypothetical protein ICN32_10545 [Polynucleobacter wuianus]|uniref:hypothetical protein n=1 Tax=Polynucleobacter wuianus TaxID=1743168 RepID=UPI001C0DFC45|nr:hypothetical protein [Polynucleobacter wuianus]MBU3610991.1 hypothetical protein [Polynucleobacter wuianus]